MIHAEAVSRAIDQCHAVHIGGDDVIVVDYYKAVGKIGESSVIKIEVLSLTRDDQNVRSVSPKEARCQGDEIRVSKLPVGWDHEAEAAGRVPGTKAHVSPGGAGRAVQLSCIILDRKHAPSFWTGLPGSRR